MIQDLQLILQVFLPGCVNVYYLNNFISAKQLAVTYCTVSYF
jgi:hypothetical protein